MLSVLLLLLAALGWWLRESSEEGAGGASRGTSSATGSAAGAAAGGGRVRERAGNGEGGGGPTPPGVVSAAGLPPVTTPAAAFGRFTLGVNEGISVPNRLLDRELRPEEVVAALRKDGEELVALGASHVRGHTGAFPRISMMSLEQRPERLESEGDVWVRAVQGSGLTPVLMLSPWPANHTANYATTYLPADMPAYEAYVARIVERYDGDGVDDMPGLTAPVRLWEVDNEPDLKWNDPPRDAKREVAAHSFCSPEEYASVLVATARAARGADPQAKILGGGVFRPYAASGEEYLQQLFASPGALEAVDVLSIHGYDGSRNAEKIQIGVAAGRAFAPGKPVWITESSLPLGDGVDEPEQARRFVAMVGNAAAAGAGAVFWHTLADPPARGEGAGHAGNFSTNSLMKTGAGDAHELKAVGRAYQALTAVLREHDLFGATLDGEGAARLTDGTTLLWDGSRPAPNGGVDLRTGAVIPPGGPAEAPAFLR